jgi:hypothetical protein
MMPLALQAVRVATRTLNGERGNQGPDVSVLELVDETGSQLMAPRWTCYTLQRHPNCLECSA